MLQENPNLNNFVLTGQKQTIENSEPKLVLKAVTGRKHKDAEAALLVANNALRKAQAHHKEYSLGLEEMMFMNSHQVRQSICQILSISGMLVNALDSPAKMKELISYIRTSALSLDLFTRQLTILMSKLEQNEKDNTISPKEV